MVLIRSQDQLLAYSIHNFSLPSYFILIYLSVTVTSLPFLHCVIPWWACILFFGFLSPALLLYTLLIVSSFTPLALNTLKPGEREMHASDTELQRKRFTWFTASGEEPSRDYNLCNHTIIKASCSFLADAFTFGGN